MPVIGDRVEVERKPKLGGGGPGKIPRHRGYGGGDDGDHDRGDDFSPHQQRLRRGRIGLAICIACVGALFIGLTVVFLGRMGTLHWVPDLQQDVHEWKPLTLPYLQLWINSCLLVLSSLTLELARRRNSEKEEFAALGIVPPKLKPELPWLAITVGLGFGFLAGQVLVWSRLRAQGVFLGSNTSRSFFFLFTGLHAAHLIGGLIALLWAACGRWLRMKSESQCLAVDLTAWYWHFMGVLWFGIFALLHFARSV